jgi:hypothetical protein
MTVGRDYGHVSVQTRAQSFVGERLVVNETSEEEEINLHYPPRHYWSDSVTSVAIPVNRADRIEVDVWVAFHSPVIAGIAFEWSMSNPMNIVVDRFASQFFCGLAVCLLFVLVKGIRRRLEQAVTIAALVLFFTSNLLFASGSKLFHFADQLLAGQLRVSLMYAIAYIGNKHRNVLTRIGFALILVCFFVDIGLAWREAVGLPPVIHAIGIHMVVCCVIESIVAAMYFWADDKFCFLVYAGVLTMSFAASIFAQDLAMAVPYFDHMIEPRIAFCGIYAIGLTVLTHFHQGAPGAESDGDRLDSDDSAADFDPLISS